MVMYTFKCCCCRQRMFTRFVATMNTVQPLILTPADQWLKHVETVTFL